MSKNTTGILAIGKWDVTGLTQLAGRLGRPCKLEAGKDIVPKEFKLIHLDSDWQRGVLKIRATKVSARSVTLSSEMQEMLVQVDASDRSKAEKDAIEGNLYKLAAADEKKTLGATTMAVDYLTAVLDESKMAEAIEKYEEARTELLRYKDAEAELEQAAS